MDIDIEGGLPLDISAFIGKSVALLGITGSGKTNTAAVLIEEMLTQGLPLTIVDIEGEYWGLKERFEVLVAGRSEHAELLLNPEQAGTLAHVSIERGISVILDLSDYPRGIITGAGTGSNIFVRFHGERWPYNCHPKWMATYYRKDGSIIATYNNAEGF